MRPLGILLLIFVALSASSPTEIVKNQNAKILIEDSAEEKQQWFTRSKNGFDAFEVLPSPGTFVSGNIGLPRSMVNSFGLKPTILKPVNGTCSDGYRLDRRNMCRLVWKR